MPVLPKRDDRGFAMITAIVVIMIVVTLGVLMSQVALHSLNTSTVNSALVQSSDAAEAGVDATVTAMQYDTSANLPCCPTSSSNPCPVHLGGTTASNYSLFVTYYTSANPPVAISCTAGTGPASTPAYAEVMTIGYPKGVSPTGASIAGETSTWDAELSVATAATPSTGFNQAVYSGSGYTTNGAVAIQDETGVSAPTNVYVGGDYVCTHSGTANAGNLVVAGDMKMGQGCTSSGTWYVAGSICGTQSSSGSTNNGNLEATGALGSSSINWYTSNPYGNGSLLDQDTITPHSSACGNSTSGNIALNSSGPAGLNAYAEGTITSCKGDLTGSSCVSNDTSVPGLSNDPIQPFPQWSLNNSTNTAEDTSAWTSAGYSVTTVSSGSNCSSTAWNDALADGVLTTPHLIVAQCQLGTPPTLSYTLNCSVAIVATGGFDITNTMSIAGTSNYASQSCNSSDTNQQPFFYMLTPYYQLGSSSVTTCNGNGNQPANDTINGSFGTTVGVMIYTPCSVTLTNSGSYVGQVYGGAGVSNNQTSGQVDITNSTTLNYEPVPIPGAGSSSGSSGSTQSYNIQLLYKRQSCEAVTATHTISSACTSGP